MSERDGNSEVYVMEADGSDPTRLTWDPGRDGAPSWSPDGRQIAFETDRNGDFEVYVMGADASDPVNLTQTPDASDGFPVWHSTWVASCVAMEPWGQIKASIRKQRGGSVEAP